MKKTKRRLKLNVETVRDLSRIVGGVDFNPIKTFYCGTGPVTLGDGSSDRC